MKLSAWARQQGVSYKTAWRWHRAGELTTSRTPTGRIIVEEQEEDRAAVALYARVSSGDQKTMG